MKTKNEIKETLKKYKPYLREQYKVEDIGFFGSFAKGDASEGSDIDILVRFYEPIGWEFIDLKEFLEEILDDKVDLVTDKALKPQLKEKILSEVVYT